MTTTFDLLKAGSNAPNGSTAWAYLNNPKTGSGTGGAIIGIDVIVSPTYIPLAAVAEAIAISVYEEPNQEVVVGEESLNIFKEEVNLNV